MPRIKHLLLFAVLALVSCGGTVYNSFKHVDNKAWSPNDTLTFVYDGVEKPGSDARLKLSALVRYNSDYKYMNLHMRVETLRMSDTTLLSVDTLCCRIYDDTGRRLGSTAGALFQDASNEVIVNAEPTDTLMLRLSHIMSDNTLAGVCDVGIRLTPEKN